MPSIPKEVPEWRALMAAEGRQAPRRIIQTMNEFLAIVCFVKFYVIKIFSVRSNFCVTT